MTEFTGDGLYVSPQDLSAITPDGSDNDRMFHHDGSSSISTVGGGSDSERGYYVWDADAGAWYPLFRNADKIDGKDAGDFLQRDGSIPMLASLDLDNYNLINAGEVKGGSGGLHLNTNHVEVHSHGAGKNIRLVDNDGLLIAHAIEGGDFNIPNGSLYEQGNRVATRSWTNAKADVPNADYANNANQLDGYDEGAFLHVSGDQMEGVFSLGANDIEDGNTTVWDASANEVPQSSLGGPADSLSAYPLAAGDLAEDYVETSRLPLIASDLAEDYVLTSRLPLPAGDLAEDYAVTSRFPIPNSDVANSSVTVTAGNQLTGGGSVSLGGTITVDVDEGAGSGLDADLLDGNQKSDLDSQYVDASGDTMSGELEANAGVSVGSSHTTADLVDIHDPNASQVGVRIRDPTAPTYGWRWYFNNNTSDMRIATVSDGVEHIGIAMNRDNGNVNIESQISEQGNRLASRTWTNANADVPNADYADNAGDSDLLDGEHASAFADAGHLHDGRYILEGGDTMSGVLTLSDGSQAASRSWVNGNADVPTADHADQAADANLLDGLNSSQFLRSDSADTLNSTLSVSGETKVQFGGSNYFARYDSGRDTLVLGSAESGEVAEIDSNGNLTIEGSLTEGATIGA